MKLSEETRIDLKSDIISGFHPIEQLFKIMSKQSEGIPDDITRSWAEIGLELCGIFRIKLDAALTNIERENQDDP